MNDSNCRFVPTSAGGGVRAGQFHLLTDPLRSMP